MKNCGNSNPETTVIAKACSGKCTGTGCAPDVYIWVVAACEGMISLFAKSPNGKFPPVYQGDNTVFSSVEEFQKFISGAYRKQSFSQLILVGSPHDLAWIRASLPEEVGKHVVAEMKYPLIGSWFQQTPETNSLSKAIAQLFTT